MDQICCLLGLCCPPAERLQRVTAWFASWGADQTSAGTIARELIAAIDAHPLGAFMKSLAAKHV
jgi:hypothetical protein